MFNPDFVSWKLNLSKTESLSNSVLSLSDGKIVIEEDHVLKFAFGKETFYKKRGKKYYRVKSDGSLASTPVNVLVQKQLDNQFNPLVEVVQEPPGKDFGIIEEK